MRLLNFTSLAGAILIALLAALLNLGGLANAAPAQQTQPTAVPATTNQTQGNPNAGLNPPQTSTDLINQQTNANSDVAGANASTLAQQAHNNGQTGAYNLPPFIFILLLVGIFGAAIVFSLQARRDALR
ncbi:MAG: hypothetical protein MUD01_06885 [Chloroflexaceae bacterium]|nr:hypothetical protein [Chloroflexaceae bacterium]